MTFYKHRVNEIIDADSGQQIAVVLPSNCSKKAARQMAAFCAQQMNHEQRSKDRAVNAEDIARNWLENGPLNWVSLSDRIDVVILCRAVLEAAEYRKHVEAVAKEMLHDSDYGIVPNTPRVRIWAARLTEKP